NGLVTEGERPAQRDEARRQEEIDVAASHGERTNQGLCVAFEARLWNVAPLDLMGRRAGELSHSSLLRPPSTAVIPQRAPHQASTATAVSKAGAGWRNTARGA